MYLANLLGVQGRNEEAEQMYRFAVTLHPETNGGVEIFGFNRQRQRGRCHSA